MNRSVILKSRPEDKLSADNFAFEDVPLPLLGDGGVRIGLQYLSPDPYMRGRMNAGKSYVEPFQVGGVISGLAAGVVKESRHPEIKEGQAVTGFWPWAEEVVIAPNAGGWYDPQVLRPINTDLAPMSAYLGILGMPGATAWVGLRVIGEPQRGDTLFVSAAAGAVGSVAGQVGRILGCRVVGSAGSDEKVDFLKGELGFHSAYNYRHVEDYDAVLGEHCPYGIDVNFENVGGAQSEAVFRRMNGHGRIILCGLISNYDPPRPEPGPPLMWILTKSIRLQGMIVSDYPAAVAEWYQKGAEWLSEGKLTYRETVLAGMESVPAAMMGLLSGENIGKMIVKL